MNLVSAVCIQVLVLYLHVVLRFGVYIQFFLKQSLCRALYFPPFSIFFLASNNESKQKQLREPEHAR